MFRDCNTQPTHDVSSGNGHGRLTWEVNIESQTTYVNHYFSSYAFVVRYIRLYSVLY